MGVIVGWQLEPWSRPELKLLNHGSKKDEKLLLCQGLAKTSTFSCSKWSDLVIIDEIARSVNETFRLEDIWIWEALGIMVAVVEECKDCGTLWNCVGSNFEVVCGISWKPSIGKTADSQTF